MSQKELQRVKVIENAVSGRLSVSEAAGLLQLSERQVHRLKQRYLPGCLAWVEHGKPPCQVPKFRPLRPRATASRSRFCAEWPASIWT